MVAKRELLVTGLASALGASFLTAGARSAIDTWLDRLEEWNARIDLTAARTPEELVDLMLADAFVLAGCLPRAVRVVDIGSGAGAPGLPLALLREDLSVTLVEPLGKRASFLRTIIGACQRPDVTLVHGRGESLVGKPRHDVAISRATLAPPAWLALATDLVEPGGQAWALLASDPAPVHPRAHLLSEHEYVWPLTGAKRRVVGYRVSS